MHYGLDCEHSNSTNVAHFRSIEVRTAKQGRDEGAARSPPWRAGGSAGMQLPTAGIRCLACSPNHLALTSTRAHLGHHVDAADQHGALDAD